MSGSIVIENHSFLRFADVRTGNDSLLCMSNNTDCCTEDNANWFLPGSTIPLTTISSPYSVSRSSTEQRNVALIRSGGGINRDDDDGLYRCKIIGTDGTIQMLYVWLDAGTEGKHNIAISLSA